MRKEFFLAALFSVGFSISALASEIALQPDFGAYTLSIDTAEETTAKFSSAKMEQTILTFCQTASERGVAQDTYLLTVQKGSYITVRDGSCNGTGYILTADKRYVPTGEDTLFSGRAEGFASGIDLLKIGDISICFVDETAPHFTDVKTGAYYEKPVSWAVESGITGGTTATTFSPEDVCTRAQAITFLWNAYGRQKTEMKQSYAAVKETDYFYEAAIWAKNKGIVTGEMFEPSLACTRGEMSRFLWNLAGTPKVTVKTPFRDMGEYADAICWVYEQKIAGGISDTTFSPEMACTRGQIITFLYNAMQ